MPGALTHSPADVLGQLLVDSGSLILPPASTGEWALAVGMEPDAPDTVVTLYDTAGRDGGRTSPDQERLEHHGVTLRFRGQTHASVFTKAHAVAIELDQVLQESVSLGGSTYLVHCVNRVSGPIANGREPGTGRVVFTLNVLVSVRETDALAELLWPDGEEMLWPDGVDVLWP